MPVDPERLRTATRWQAEGPLVRLQIGLEDPDDLIEDLAARPGRLRGRAMRGMVEALGITWPTYGDWVAAAVAFVIVAAGLGRSPG